MKLLICLFFVFFPSFVFAKDYSGAIAIYKKTGITGSANDFSRPTVAEEVAVSNCNRNNNIKSGCTIAISVSNGCMAVAWSPTTTIWNGEDANDKLEVAKRKAVLACKQRGASDCKPVEAICTSWEERWIYW